MDGLWFFTVAIGPVILGLVFVYVLSRRRKLNPREQEAQHEAVDELYDRDKTQRPKEER